MQRRRDGNIRLDVELYIPNPLRCYKCQKYGHDSNTCPALRSVSGVELRIAMTVAVILKPNV